MVLQYSRHQIDILCQLFPLFSGTFSIWHFHEERDMGHLIIRMHIILTGKSVFSQHMAVIRSQDHQCPIIQPVLLQSVEKMPQPPIRHGHSGQITVPKM